MTPSLTGLHNDCFSHPRKTLDGEDDLLTAILVIIVKTSLDLRIALNLHLGPSDPLQGTDENCSLSPKKERKPKQALKLMRSINNRLQRGFC